MTGRLLEYEFWKNHTAYYIGLFTGVLAKKDRLEKRKYFAKEILETPSRPIRWLDIGTGDGSKILDTIRCIKERDHAATIELIAIEPSEYIVAGLKEKLSKIDGVSLEVRNDKFALEKLKPNTFDCITFFHAAYYLATEEEEFEEIYRRVHDDRFPQTPLLLWRDSKRRGKKLCSQKCSASIFPMQTYRFSLQVKRRQSLIIFLSAPRRYIRSAQ